MNISPVFLLKRNTNPLLKTLCVVFLFGLLLSTPHLVFSCEAAQMPEQKTEKLSEGVEQTINETSLPISTEVVEWVFKPAEATSIIFADTLDRSVTIPNTPLAFPNEITSSTNNIIKKQRKRARAQQARLDTIESYTDVVKSIMVEKVSYDLYNEAVSLHRQAKQQFEAGAINHYELLAADHNEAKYKALFLRDQSRKERAQRALMYRLGLHAEASKAPSSELLFPQELSFISGEFDWMGGDTMKDTEYDSFKAVVTQAVSTSPEWHILKASVRSKHPENSDYSALLHNRWHDAYLKHQQQIEQLDLKQHQLKMARTILKEIKISENSGFASNQDVIKARIGLTIASAEYVASKLDVVVAFFALTRETGELNAPK